MKPKSVELPLKRVLLWPEIKIYESRGPIFNRQRIPFCKGSIVSRVGKTVIYFEGEPIILN
jgi:hypothetical protein